MTAAPPLADFRIPEIETARLRLRLPRASDFPAHAAFRAAPRSAGVGGPFDRASSWHHLESIVGQWWLRGYGRWLVADRDGDTPLGIVGVYHPDDWPEPEIGWSLYEGAEGRGIAAEAATAARRFVHEVLGWDRIVSLVKPSNARSVALARRLGCVREGEFAHPVHGRLDIWLHPGPSTGDRPVAIRLPYAGQTDRSPPRTPPHTPEGGSA